MPISLCYAAATLILVGCAHQLRFRVVDANSGSGLPGVSVRAKEVSSITYFQRAPHGREIGTTDTNGLISVSGVSTKDVFYFSALGYQGAAAGFVEHGQIAIGPYPPTNVDTMFRDRKVVNRKEVILIPLVPLSSTQ